MDILLCVLGKLLPQILIHSAQWSSRLCKAKQLFYGVNGNVVFRTFSSSIFLGRVIIFLSCLQTAPEAKCYMLELIKRLDLMEFLPSSSALPKG